MSLGIETVPALVVVDSRSNLAGVYQGLFTPDEFHELAAALGSGGDIPVYTSPGQVGSPALEIAAQTLPETLLLTFHSATCAACVAQIPELTAYATQNPDLPVWVVTADALDTVEAQFPERPANLVIVRIEDMQAYADYAIRATPTQILVHDDSIVWRNEGFIPQMFEGIPLRAYRPGAE